MTEADTLCFMTISELSGRLERKEVSPVEVTTAVLDRIERHDRQMRSFVTVTADLAFERAREAESEIMVGRRLGPLHGVPIAVKDNIATRGVRTSCGALVNPDWVPTEDAAIVARLAEAGAVPLGKTNLYEYAFSLTPAVPQPLNPWNEAKSSSGSSSGSAVAVAVGMAHGSIGTDTGGSGRHPASVNGVVGLKGTYGRISRDGVVPLSFSLDHVSVFGRSVMDVALLTDAATDHHLAVPETRGLIGRPISGLRIGRARGYTVSDIDEDVVRVVDEAVDVLSDLGATVEDVDLPHVEHAAGLLSAIMLPEAASVHHRALRATPEKLGQTALMRLDLGSVIPAATYIRALQAREAMRPAYRQLFARYAVIIGPTNAVRAGVAGEWQTEVNGERIDLRETGPEYTGIYNLTGSPAAVVPAGFSSEGTPLGLQLAGRWWDEATVLQVAAAFEEATEWHLRRPPMPAPSPS